MRTEHAPGDRGITSVALYSDPPILTAGLEAAGAGLARAPFSQLRKRGMFRGRLRMMNVSMTDEHSKLKYELAHFGIRVLRAGILVQAALMPLFLCGAIERRTLPPTLLAVTLGLNAVFVLLMAFKLPTGRRRILQIWLSFRLTHAMHGVLCGPDRRKAAPAGQLSEEGSRRRRMAKCAKRYYTHQKQP
jgi:hypothetical protein